MDQETHTFNLKAVVMETGLKPVTLRAWERRYGFPEPRRTPGGHRLYSQRDIDTLKWLIARQKEGMSISRAVALWRSLEDEGEDPIHAVSPVTGVASTAILPGGVGEQLTDLRQAWIQGCFAFDDRQVDAVMTKAFSRFPSEIVVLEILQKGLFEIGMGWYEGSVSVQQEHFASTHAMRRLEILVAAQPAPTRSSRILVGSAPKDTHTFSTLLLTFFLRRHGWDVIYLGADVPSEQLAETIKLTEPDLVIFTAQLLHTAVALLSIAQVLAEQDLPLAFGGLIFNGNPSILERMPGYYLGTDITEAPNNIRKLLIGALPLNEPVAIDQTYVEARLEYEQYRAHIEAGIWVAFSDYDFPPHLLQEINTFFGRDISASLQFGDINLLENNITWLKTLLKNYGWNQEWFYRYLQTYHSLAAEYLESPEHPLTTWLATEAV